MEKKFGDFANRTAKKFGLAAIAAGAFAAKIGYDAVKAAMEDQKSQVLLANSLRNTVNATDATIAATEEYISAMQAEFGVADDQLRPALANLAAVTGDVGKAQSLLGVSMDIAAAKTIDLESKINYWIFGDVPYDIDMIIDKVRYVNNPMIGKNPYWAKRLEVN
jgi:hypothetical protein